MSVVVVSSVVGSLIFVVSAFVIYYTQQRLADNFNTMVTHTILDTNVRNKLGSDENELIKLSQNRYENNIANSTNNLYNSSKMVQQSQQHTKNLIDGAHMYKMQNNDELNVVQAEISNIYKTQVPLYIAGVDQGAVTNGIVQSSLNVKSATQNIGINNLNNIEKNVHDNLKIAKEASTVIDRNYLKFINLNTYTKRSALATEAANWNTNISKTRGDINLLNTNYETRPALNTVISMNKLNTNLANTSLKSFADLETTLIPKTTLKSTKFPVSSYQLPPQLATVYNNTKMDISNNTSRVRTSVPRDYVHKDNFKKSREVIRTTSFPMISFPRQGVMMVDGRVGISETMPQGKFASKNDSISTWNTVFQNKDSTVNIARGDGLGMQITTRNNSADVSALTINNYREVYVDVRNDGNTSFTTINPSRAIAQHPDNAVVSSNPLDQARLCINNTCIYERDLYKAALINIKPPTQKLNFASNYTIESVLSFNLNDYFSDVTGVVLFTLITNPQGNASLSGSNNSILSIVGNYRNRSYQIVLRAANNNGGYVDKTISITEPATQDCRVSDFTWNTCSKTCGGGTQSGTRSIVQYRVGPGANCPSLTGSQSCNTQACPIYPTPIAKHGWNLPDVYGTMGEVKVINLQNFVTDTSGTVVKYVLNNGSSYPNAYINEAMLYVHITNPVRYYSLDINVTNGNGDGKTIMLRQRMFEKARLPIINARFSELILSSSGNIYAKSVTYDLSIYFTNFPESGSLTYYIANGGVYGYITGRNMTVYYSGWYVNSSYSIVVRAQNGGGTAEQILTVREVY